MSRRTAAVRLAARVIDSLTATDDGALPAARAAADLLSYEIAKLQVLEAPARVAAELDLAALGLGDRAMKTTGEGG